MNPEKLKPALTVVLVLVLGGLFFWTDLPNVVTFPVALGVLIFAIWLTGGFEKKKGYGRGGGD